HEAVNSSVSSCRSEEGRQHWRPLGSSACERSAQSDQTRYAPAGGGRRGRSLGYLRQLLDRHLQVLGRPECDLLARFDLDGFSGRGFAPTAGGVWPDWKDAKTHIRARLSFLELLGDKPQGAAEDPPALAFGDLMTGRHLARQSFECTGAAGLGPGWCHRFPRH